MGDDGDRARNQGDGETGEERRERERNNYGVTSWARCRAFRLKFIKVPDLLRNFITPLTPA